MPARRLPWLKLWPEAMRHEKVALLPDGVFRTWVCMLAASAEQPVRGRFASLQHAVIVTGRPSDDFQHLLAVGLLDYAEGALWVHDWSQWQDKYPSDFTDAEHSANTPRTLRQNSVNAPSRLPLDTEEELRVKETEERRKTPTPQPPSPQAGPGEHANGNQRRRRRSEIPTTGPLPRGGDDPTAPPTREVPADLTPPTAADRALWDAARDRLTDEWLPSNAAKTEAFVLLGRDPAGWLHVGVPPDARSVASQPALAAALIWAGDPFGSGVVIVEGT